MTRLSSILNWLSYHRVRVSFLVVLVLVVDHVLAGVRPHSPFSWSDPAGPIGTGLMLAGLLMRSWSAGVVHKNQQLATRGPYSLTRHPLYAGSLLMILGMSLLVWQVWALVVVLLLYVMLYVPKVRAEERTMAELFGQQWEDYVTRTSMFFPRSWRPQLRTTWSLGAWLRNREYWASAATAIILALAAVLSEPHLISWSS